MVVRSFYPNCSSWIAAALLASMSFGVVEAASVQIGNVGNIGRATSSIVPTGATGEVRTHTRSVNALS